MSSSSLQTGVYLCGLLFPNVAWLNFVAEILCDYPSVSYISATSPMVNCTKSTYGSITRDSAVSLVSHSNFEVIYAEYIPGRVTIMESVYFSEVTFVTLRSWGRQERESRFVACGVSTESTRARSG